MCGNLQAITEKGGISKQKCRLESKLHKSILVDGVFINSMLQIPLIINYAEQFKMPPLKPHPRPGSYAPALFIDFTGFQKNFTKLNTTFYLNDNVIRKISSMTTKSLV